MKLQEGGDFILGAAITSASEAVLGIQYLLNK